MKKTILVLLITGLFAYAASAQGVPTPPPSGQNPPPMMGKDRMKERREMMVKHLKDIGATDEQILKCKDAMEDSKKKNDDLKNNAALTDDEKKAKRKETMTEQESKLKEILGDDKFAKYRDAMKAMRKDMPPPPPREAPAAPKN